MKNDTSASVFSMNIDGDMVAVHIVNGLIDSLTVNNQVVLTANKKINLIKKNKLNYYVRHFRKNFG